MNALENLLDKKAALLNDETEQNLFAFCIALLDAPLLVPCEFDFKDFDFGSPDSSMLEQGTVIPWARPEYKTAVAEREGRKWLQVFTDKTSMPEQYRTRCIQTDGRGVARIAHEQENIDGLMLDPGGGFIPVPVEYIENVIQIIDNYKGDRMSGSIEDNISNETEAKNESNEITDNVFDEIGDEGSLESVSLDSLEITDIAGFNGGFVIRWGAPEIGFGEYTIHAKVKRDQFGFAEDDVLLEGDSECMDSNEDKSFLRALLKKVVEKISIVS